MMDNFCWWLEHEAKVEPALAALTPRLMRQFLTYTREPQPNGRWGCNRSRSKQEARPSTTHRYFRELRTFFNFCLREGHLEHYPLENVKAPKIPDDQIQPFVGEQVQALINAARTTQAPLRNAAIILLLVDTGMRVSELLGLTVGDADLDADRGELVVTGKGNKKRSVFVSARTRRELWRYLECEERRGALPGEPLFTSVGGSRSGTAMAKTGVHRVIQVAGQIAGIQGVRCSPHTLRHTFAVEFLKSGRNLFELQQLMGHTDLTVLRRYVALAQADLEKAHRAGSPVDRMRLK